MTRVFLTIGLLTSIFCSFACVDKGGNATTANTGTKSSMRSQFARSFLALAGRAVINSLRRSAGLQ